MGVPAMDVTWPGLVILHSLVCLCVRVCKSLCSVTFNSETVMGKRDMIIKAVELVVVVIVGGGSGGGVRWV